jgi:hypothetical protein
MLMLRPRPRPTPTCSAGPLLGKKPLQQHNSTARQHNSGDNSSTVHAPSTSKKPEHQCICSSSSSVAACSRARVAIPAVSVQAEHHYVGVLCKYLAGALAVVHIPAAAAAAAAVTHTSGTTSQCRCRCVHMLVHTAHMQKAALHMADVSCQVRRANVGTGVCTCLWTRVCSAHLQHTSHTQHLRVATNPTVPYLTNQ